MEKIKVLNLANTVGKNSGGIGNVVHALTRYGNKDGKIDSHLWFNGDETLANRSTANNRNREKKIKNLIFADILKYILKKMRQLSLDNLI